MSKGKHYTRKEVEQMVSAYNSGTKVREIAKATGRSEQGIMNLVWRLKKKNLIKPRHMRKPVIEVVPAGMAKEKTLGEFTFSEIIEYLYNCGFRIKDNGLVHVTETPVKLENIIKSEI